MTNNGIRSQIKIDGPWLFQLGVDTEWHEINVPSSWESQGYSFNMDGPARYRKVFQLPAEWAGHRIFIDFNAVSYACKIYVNDSEIGHHQGMWTPFSIDITPVVIPGSENVIEIEIYKPGWAKDSRYPVRSSLAGFLPDLACPFGGIWQSVCLSARLADITSLQIDPVYDDGAIQISCKAEIYQQATTHHNWQVCIRHHDHLIAEEYIPYRDGEKFSINLKLDRIKLWSPARPELYEVSVSLIHGSEKIAHVIRSVGFRRLSANGSQLLLNEEPYLVRGILSWGWDPDTVAPYYSLESARAEIAKIKKMGFNCIKLCLFIPNQEFFRAADEDGILLWLEFPMWLPDFSGDLRERVSQEYFDIVNQTRHHPSVVLYSLGCELNQAADANLLGQLNAVVRNQIRDALLCDNSGSGESYGGLDVDFADFTDYHPYFDIHFFEPLLNHWRRDWATSRPWIFGEFCDSDTFRDVDEIIMANHAITPWWMTDQNPVTGWRAEAKALLDEKERIAKAGLVSSVRDLINISYNQAYVIRKYTLETLRRRNGMGGYIITGLRDTPISTSGIWNDLGRPKWTPEVFSAINNEDMLCLDTDRRRTWHAGGDRPDPIDPYNVVCGSLVRWQVLVHCSSVDFPSGGNLFWRLETLSGDQISSNRLVIDQIVQAGSPTKIASIACQIPQFHQAQILRLSLELSGFQRVVKNEWLVWTFPLQNINEKKVFLYDPNGLMSDWGDSISGLHQISPDEIKKRNGVLLTSSWNSKVEDYLMIGGKILLLQQGDGPFPACRLPFWREAINFFSDHPLWQGFPHQNFTDMQFFGLATDIVFDMDRLLRMIPKESHYRPVMQRLDARDFLLRDYIFEIQSSNGTLIGCSLRINGGTGSQPTGLRRNIAGAALLSAALNYLTSL